MAKVALSVAFALKTTVSGSIKPVSCITGLGSAQNLAGRNFASAMAATKKDLSSIPEVQIDDSGNYKYILVNVEDANKNSTHIIRGTGSFTYHKDIFEELQRDLGNWNVKPKCLGGGRIEKKENDIRIHGTSEGYGQADHKVAEKILKKAYPNAKVYVEEDKD